MDMAMRMTWLVFLAAGFHLATAMAVPRGSWPQRIRDVRVILISVLLFGLAWGACIRMESTPVLWVLLGVAVAGTVATAIRVTARRSPSQKALVRLWLWGMVPAALICLIFSGVVATGAYESPGNWMLGLAVLTLGAPWYLPGQGLLRILESSPLPMLPPEPYSMLLRLAVLVGTNLVLLSWAGAFLTSRQGQNGDPGQSEEVK